MFKKILLLLIIFFIGTGFGYSFLAKKTAETANTNTQINKNISEAFISEIYDKIKDNYWDNISDAQLLELFKNAFDKNGSGVLVVKFDNKDKLLSSLKEATKDMDGAAKNKFIAAVSSTVLQSLNPIGRSGLYTTKQEEQLKNTVANINPEKDLYKDLGVSKDASDSAIQEAYKAKEKELASDKSANGQEKLKQLAYAKDVLTQKDQKQRYDQNQVEPTIFTNIISSNTLYFQFKKFSPTSYDEFIKAFDSYKDNTLLNSLIFDLRGNIGGAIDATSYFLGNFIGKNQYAFDFYHKGEFLPFKSATEKLASISKYKQIVILIDNQTQSSAEMMAASLKKYHIGILVGIPTKGWGTVERVFPIDNQFDKTQKYSLFLVHSITLRDDNQPIEGRGVDPDVNIKNASWEQQLLEYFRNPNLTEAVKGIL